MFHNAKKSLSKTLVCFLTHRPQTFIWAFLGLDGWISSSTLWILEFEPAMQWSVSKMTHNLVGTKALNHNLSRTWAQVKFHDRQVQMCKVSLSHTHKRYLLKHKLFPNHSKNQNTKSGRIFGSFKTSAMVNFQSDAMSMVHFSTALQ